MSNKKKNTSYESQRKLSFLNFIAELPNFLCITASAVVSGSLIVWMDFVDSLGNVLNAGFVALLSHKLRRNLKYEYNYGVGKIEAISSVVCNGIIICGLIFMLISSVNDLISPKEPSGFLIYVVLLKIVNVSLDIYFLQAQYKIKKAGNSAIADTEYSAQLKSFAFDAVALVSLVICWVFRDVRAVWYFSPIICIILSVLFFIGAVTRSVESVHILTDRTLPESDQKKILAVLSKYNNEFKNFGFLSSRKSGDTAFIDLSLSFDDNTTFAQIKSLCHDIQYDIEAQVQNSKVSIVINDALL